MTTIDVGAFYRDVGALLTEAGRADARYCIELMVWNHRREFKDAEIEWKVWFSDTNKSLRGITPDIILDRLRIDLKESAAVDIPTVVLPATEPTR